MDPVANLAEQRQLAARIIENSPGGYVEDDGARLAELVLALDAWRVQGGFDPWTTDDTSRAVTHLAHTIDAMRQELERAQIRDAWRTRATRIALTVALLAPTVMAKAENDPERERDHFLAVYRAMLDDAAKLAIPINEIPVEDVARDLGRYVNTLAAEGSPVTYLSHRDLIDNRIAV